ncbi:hypothetical protein BB558_005663, partial [Smittium angustum]
MKVSGIAINGKKTTKIFILTLIIITLLLLTLNTQKIQKKYNRYGAHKKPIFSSFLEDQSDMDFPNSHKLDSLEFDK